MTDSPRTHPRLIALTGFMATGKTAAGRALADLIGFDFLDTDTRIEEKQGMRIRDIFARDGEARFRTMERALCEELRECEGVVVATGGGMLIDPDNFRFFEERGAIVLLETSLDVLCERLESDTLRPLAAASLGDDTGESLRERIRRLLDSRAPVYDRIALRVDTSHRTPLQSAATIAARLALTTQTHVVDPMGAVAHSGTPPSTGRFGRCVIEVGRGGLTQLGAHLHRAAIDRRALVVIPRQLEPLFLPQIDATLEEAGVPYKRVAIEDGEENKTLDQVASLFDRIVDFGTQRDTTLVAVGGGVTGDLAGFVAATYMRGLPLVQVPTTLLAQVDASIGGKVGVNHPRGKNLIGSFYQPHLVVTDPCTLRSLPDDELANGMAEVVKSAWIGSADLFEWIESHVEPGNPNRLRDTSFLERCIREAASIKIDIVNEDPYEGDRRRALNLGHTLGHALESSSEYRGIKHGQAVSLGLVAAVTLAVRRGTVDPELLRRTRRVLEGCGLPTRFDRIDVDSLSDTLWLDKKVRAGRLHFVLPRNLGQVDIVDDVTVDEIFAAIREDTP